MYAQFIKDLSDFCTRKNNPLEQSLIKSKMSSTEDLDELSYNSLSSHSTDGYIHETLKHESDIVNIHLDESIRYKSLVENLEFSKLNYDHFKNNLKISEHIQLLSQIEERLNQISECKIDLLKAKYQDEINLKISSIKFVMEKMNKATIKWSNEEHEKKIAKMKQELELNRKIILDYENRLKDLSNEDDSCQIMIEVKNKNKKMNCLEKDIEVKSQHIYDINNQFDYLRDEINEKDQIIESLKAKEDVYLGEISRLKSQFNDFLELNTSKENNTNFEMESVLIDTTTDSIYREPKIGGTQMRDDRVNGLILELEAKNKTILDLNDELNKLKEDIETMTHPFFFELQNEMQKHFDEEYEELKVCYEKKIREELEIYKNISNQRVEEIENENQKKLAELEAKHKFDLDQLEIDFNRTLSKNLFNLKNEIQKTQKENKDVDIKFRYSNTQNIKELNYLVSKSEEKDYLNENELYTVVLDCANSTSIAATKFNANNSLANNQLVTNTQEQMPLNLEISNSNISFTDDEKPVSNSYQQTIKAEATSNDFLSLNGNEKLIELEIETNRPVEYQDKLKQLELKNKNLQGTLETLYAKDDIYMASYRRENEERNNYIKLLQSDIQQINLEKSSLTANNQNLLSLLSKSILISVSLDEHIAKRLSKISQNQNTDFNNGAESPKDSNHLSSTESGLHRSSGSSEIGSNEDISEEGLDTSHRIYETLASSDFTDETLIDANLKVQASIDKVLDKLEETSKKLTESHSLQIQLAFKFDENQKMLNDFKNRCQNLESDFDERTNEMQTKINNLEGLVSAYELEICQKKNAIANLEQNLADTKQELLNAKHLIENEKTELSNMELIRKDLEAQRSLYVNNLQDSDIKDLDIPINNNNSPKNELILNNSYLLDEKHELEYKLNKTSELSQQQIKDLEETVENFNEEIKSIKESYEEQLDDLKRQISSMDSQIRSDKAFIDQQMTEREQEREDYENKINELRLALNRKSTQVLDDEDNNLKEKKELEDMIQEKLDRINQISLENENLERHVNEKNEQLDKLNQKFKEIEFKLENMNKEKSDYEAQSELFKEEIDTLMKSNKNQSNLINDLREKMADLQAKYDNQFEMNENWAIEKEDLIQQKNDIQTELYSYMNRVSDLQIFKENFETEAKNKIEKFEETIANLNFNINDKENSIENLKEQLNDLNENFQSRLDAEIKQLEFVQDNQSSDLIKSYEDQIESYKLEIQSLKTEIKSKESYEISQSLIDSKNEQIDELNTEIEKLTSQIKASKQISQDLQDKITIDKEKFENEIQNLTEMFKIEIADLNKKIEAINSDKCGLIDQNELLKTETDNLKKLNEQLNNNLEQASQENKIINEDIEAYKNDSKLKEENIETLNKEINELNKKLVDSEAKVNELNDVLKDIEEKVTDQSLLEELKVKFEFEKETLSKKIDELKIYNEELKINTDEIKADFQQKNTQLIIENENLVSENDDLKRRQNELNNLISELELKLEQIVEIDKKTLEQKIEELGIIHKQELDNMNDTSHNQIDKLKDEYEKKIAKLKGDHSRQLNEEIERVRKELIAEYDNKIQSLKETFDNEDMDSVKLACSELSISNENFKKLKEQIQLSKQLDQDILGKVGQNLNENDESQIQDKTPEEVREILEKLDNEGVLLLTLSEILMLKNHFQNKKWSPDLEKLAEQAEKDKLTKEIHLLKEIIENFSTQNTKDDWRTSFLTTISEIFSNHKDLMLSELRTFICSGCLNNDENYLKHLEKKIDDLANWQKKSIDYLHSADRHSMAEEIKSMQAELNKLLNELRFLQENERERKREIKLVEYAKDAEIIKANDLKQSLNLEKNKNLDLIDKLNQEKKKTNMMQDQLYELNEEVVKIKELLNIESNNFCNLCKELDKEKNKNDQLSKALEAKTRASITQDENDYKSEYIRFMKNNPDDFTKQQNLNGKKLAVLENQFFELEKHTNNLDQLLIQEKAKYEKLAKAYGELKSRYISLGSVNNGNNLERIRQSLEYLAIKHKDEIDSASKAVSNEVKQNLNSIIDELENVSSNSYSISVSQNNNGTDLETKLLRQNRELLGSVKKLTNEKSEIRSKIQKLEEELWIMRNKNQKTHTNSNSMSDLDREKFKKLYIKYLRAESFRKSLVYQKRFLLIMLSGYEETEREIMTTLKLETNSTLKNNKYPLIQENNKNGSFYYSSRFTIHKSKSRFRTAAICIIAINRIKFLQRKHSYMATRVDSQRPS